MSLVARDLNLAHDDVAYLDSISAEFSRGELTAVIGRTLAGKTTLLRAIAGLQALDTGEFELDGQPFGTLPAWRRDVAMVYQQFINYPHLNVFENVAFPLRRKRLDDKEISRRVDAVLATVGLAEFGARKPGALSGGQQQRVALARALVRQADILLLDEPLVNLDYKLREQMREEFRGLFEASGAIFVYATTEPQEALLLGGKTATLWQGRVTQLGPTPEVYRPPRDAIPARVFSDPPRNLLQVTKAGGRLRFGGADGGADGGGSNGGGDDGGALPVFAAMAGLADGPYTLGFRANHLRLSDPGPGALCFTAQVVVTEITGSETFVHLDHGPSRWVALVHGVRDLAPGAAQPAFVDPAQVYVFGPDSALAAAAAYATAA